MRLQSLEFLAFFAVFYLIYLRCGHRSQNRLLLLASYAFYASWKWWFPLPLLFSTFTGHRLALAMRRSGSERRRKALLLTGITSDMAILAFFKYFDFFTNGQFPLNILLPVGLSFYTFKSIAYLVDIYRNQTEPVKSFFDYALFISMFTQLLAGPIERASHLLPQILARRNIRVKDFYEGSWLFFWGLYKKVAIADNLANIASPIFSHPLGHSGSETLIGIYAFAFQIFCDFSGYTDMARGLSKMMGFDLMINFRTPYSVTNPSDFWKHWHISLSTWLRDYLYIPLGGNRKGPLLTLQNLFITMLLGGLWHGASWMFILWGAYHAGLLALHRVFHPKLPRVVAVLAMFHLTCLGWLLFNSTSPAQVSALLQNIFFQFNLNSTGFSDAPKLLALIAPVLIFQWLETRGSTVTNVLCWPSLMRTTVYLVLFFSLFFWGGIESKEFVYFQF